MQEEQTKKSGTYVNKEKRKERRMDRLDNLFWESTVSYDSIYFDAGILLEVQLFKENEWEGTRYRKKELPWGHENESCITGEQSSVLKLLIETRIEAVLGEGILRDDNYRKINTETRRKIKKIEDIGLSREQWLVVDDALSACNNRSFLYGKTAYYQGFEDAVCLLREIYRLV